MSLITENYKRLFSDIKKNINKNKYTNTYLVSVKRFSFMGMVLSSPLSPGFFEEVKGFEET